MIETDVQKPVFQHQGVTLCRFHCPAGHARWRRENQIRDGHNLAFPNVIVEIRHQRSQPVFVDPNQVVYYNDRDCFHRRLVRDDGDTANVFLFDSHHVAESLRRHDPSVDDRPESPFRLVNGPAHPRTSLRQQLLFDYVMRSSCPDPVQVVEESLAILDESLAAAYEVHPSGSGARKKSTRNDHHDQVEEVKRQLSEHCMAAVSLKQLATGVGLSVYHMCRIFRRHTGLPVYRYVQRLRLRSALDALTHTSHPLAEVALATGFSNQSHFTEAFRREYGWSPGKLRKRMGEPAGP